MLLRTLFPYRLLGALIFGYAAIVTVALHLNDVRLRIDTTLVFISYSLQSSAILVLGLTITQVRKLYVVGETRPTRALLVQARNWAMSENRAVHAILGFLCFMSMIALFSAVKSTMPRFVSFSFDQVFFELDRRLFFGHDPYALLLPMFGGDVALTVLSFFYQLWLLCVVASILWVVLSANHRMRVQFLFANFFGFSIAGNLLAVLLFSAGPCYFDEVLNDHKTYAPLFEHLQDAHNRLGTVWPLDAQQMLWENHVTSHGNISGISAMPSLHNLHAWLWVFLVWSNPLARAVSIFFAIMIFIGSIVLGWHYAVDSIAGVFLAFVCWWLACKFTDWSFNRTPMRHVQNG